jgi:hypothetical protein
MQNLLALKDTRASRRRLPASTAACSFNEQAAIGTCITHKKNSPDYEGNLRQRYVFRDRFEDEHYFGLLLDEWLRSV